MEKLKFISTIIILTCLFACEPGVTFNEPQPTNTDNLSKFPNRLQGRYISLADSTELTISDNLIQRVYDFDQKIHPSQLDSNSRIVGDTIIDLKTNERTLIKHDGDSLITHVHYIDTLFKMNDDNVARKFKGYYFLNKRYDKESWKVTKIELSKEQLVVGNISSKIDLDNLKEITESSLDTVPPYKFSATRKQFKGFIKNGGFSNTETFMRQKKNTL